MTVTYRHENSYSYKKKGVKHTLKESITDGDLGMSFYFLKKVGDNKTTPPKINNVKKFTCHP